MVKKLFWAVIVVLALVIAGLYWAIQEKSRTMENIHSFVKAAQKDVPRFIDENTYLENVHAEALTIIFDYLVGNGLTREEETQAQAQELEQVFNLAMCETEYRKTLLEEGVDVVFLYKNPNEEISEFRFSLENCQGIKKRD